MRMGRQSSTLSEAEHCIWARDGTAWFYRLAVSRLVSGDVLYCGTKQAGERLEDYGQECFFWERERTLLI